MRGESFRNTIKILTFIDLYSLLCFVLHSVLTCIRQENAHERYRNTMKDLLSSTVSQKDEKPHTAGLDGAAISHVKISIIEIPLEKKLNTVNPSVPLIRRFTVN